LLDFMHITQWDYQRICLMVIVQIHQPWYADSNMILLTGVFIMALAFGKWCCGEYFPKHQPQGSQLRLMLLEDLYIRAPDGLQQICQACPMMEGDMSRHALGDAKKSLADCQGVSKTGSIHDVQVPVELRRIYKGSLKGNGSLLNA